MKIAIDFDGTLTNEPFSSPQTLKPSIQQLEVLKSHADLFVVTARRGKRLRKCKRFLKSNNVLDYFKSVGNKKVQADFYFDDRSMPIDWQVLLDVVTTNVDAAKLASEYFERLV